MYPSTVRLYNTEPTILETLLYTSSWAQQSDTVFRALIPGQIRRAQLVNIPPDTPLVLLSNGARTTAILTNDHRVKWESVGFTTIVLAKVSGMEIVDTFQPGDPPWVYKTGLGSKMTAREALSHGFLVAEVCVP